MSNTVVRRALLSIGILFVVLLVWSWLLPVYGGDFVYCLSVKLPYFITPFAIFTAALPFLFAGLLVSAGKIKKGLYTVFILGACAAVLYVFIYAVSIQLNKAEIEQTAANLQQEFQLQQFFPDQGFTQQDDVYQEKVNIYKQGERVGYSYIGEYEDAEQKNKVTYEVCRLQNLPNRQMKKFGDWLYSGYISGERWNYSDEEIETLQIDGGTAWIGREISSNENGSSVNYTVMTQSENEITVVKFRFFGDYTFLLHEKEFEQRVCEFMGIETSAPQK